MIINDRVRTLVAKLESDNHLLSPEEREATLGSLIQELHTNCAKPEVRRRYQAYAAKQNRLSPEEVDLSLYPMDDDGYAHAFDVLNDEEKIWAAWSKFGLVVDKNVVDGKLCEKTMARIREIASSISGNQFSIDDPRTHQFMPKDPNGTPLISRGFFEIYHDNSLAQLRQAVRVYLHHVLIWGRTDLWTTYDRYGVKLPGHPDSAGLPLHVDQNPTVHPSFTTVQGVLALTDCPTQRGTFVAVPESKKLFPQYGDIVKAREDNYKGEYVELDLKQPFGQKLEAGRQIIPLRSGSIVSWDSRTTHANSPNVSGEARLVAYISAGPAPEFDDKALSARQDAFRSGLGSNVRDAKMHASKKPRYTSEQTLAPVRQAEQLNTLGNLLYGFNRYARPIKSKAKLLLNAEAFGFGPTAAIADFFPLLRQKFETLAFVGPKHTLDLQHKLPYDKIYNQDQMSEKDFSDLLDQYDVFFTSFDFDKAAIAAKKGMPTIIYDSITWFWDKIHPVLSDKNVFYLAQDFFGVRERITAHPEQFAMAKVVPPLLIADIQPQDKDCVLINLGGIKNPFWSNDEVLAYAQKIIDALSQSIPANEKVLIAASQVVAEGIEDPRIKTYSRDEIQALLPRVKYAAITPGLSNIYDMAHYNIPTLYLPPANDSQGQQAALMCQHGMNDANIDWADLGLTVNYKQHADVVLKAIGGFVKAIQEDPAIKEKLVKTCADGFKKVSALQTSASHALAVHFGAGGIEQVANSVRSFVDYKLPYGPLSQEHPGETHAFKI